MLFLKTHSHKIISYAIIAGITVFIIIASFWYKEQHKEEDALKQGIAYRNQQENREYKEKTDAYYIDVTYPIIRSEATLATNQRIRDIYLARIAEFKKLAEKSFVAIEDTDLHNETSSYYSVYNVSFAQIAKTNRFISLVALGDMSIFNDALHSRNDIDTFVFDRVTKKLVSQEDMFVASSSYLTLLSKLVQEEFEKRGLTVSKEVFAPSKENFSKIVPTKNGLMIYIRDPKSPSSLLYQQVVLPYTKLKGVINKEGILSDYIG